MTLKRISATCVAVLPLFASSALAQTVLLENDLVRFEVNPATLEVHGAPEGMQSQRLAAPAFVHGVSQAVQSDRTSAEWTVTTENQQFRVSARLSGESLAFSIKSEQPGSLHWPNGRASASIEAYALPVFGEGRYVPATDTDYLKLLSEKAGSKDLSEVSLPFFTQLRGTFSSTWMFPQGTNAQMVLETDADGFHAGLKRDFSELSQEKSYEVRLTLGPVDPVIGAKQFRKFLQETGLFVSLADKASSNLDVQKLAGAPHIYFHDKGPLAPKDVKAWRRFVRVFDRNKSTANSLSARLWASMSGEAKKELATIFKEAKGEGGYVSKYAQKVIIRAINEALPKAVSVAPVAPLAGGHDLRAQPDWVAAMRAQLTSEFKGLLKAPETWGSSFNVAAIKELQSNGIDRAWLGTSDWYGALWNLEAVKLAKEQGYLVGVYDSYASAHSENQRDSWQTAQMGDEIFGTAGYQREDGSYVKGFGGKGRYVNPVAVEDYFKQRTKDIVASGQLNSLFVDVDATGLAYEDYSAERRTMQNEAMEALQSRLKYASDELGVVVGSEGGTWAFAPQIAFSHGMTTPPFGWMDKRVRFDKKSKFYRGGYWPTEEPPIFYKPIDLPEELRELMYAPQYKLPLYQIALHDSVVTTHHWEFGSLKAREAREDIALQQILYQIPPLYHLGGSATKRDMPYIAAYHSIWAPLHESLYDQQMIWFAFVSQDRLVQSVSYANGTQIIANFAAEPHQLNGGSMLPSKAFAVVEDGSVSVHRLP